MASTVEILPPPRRDANGRWLPGCRSPNAGGVSRERRQLIDLARELSPAVLETVFAIMRDETVAPAVRLVAAGMIWDRAHGRPRIAVETGERGRTLEELLRDAAESRRAKQAQERAEGGPLEP